MMFCNDSLCAIIAIPGRADRDEQPSIHADEAFKRVYETFLRVYHTGEPPRRSIGSHHKDGSKKIVEASVTLIRDVKGAPPVSGCGARHHRRKRAEEQARCINSS